MNILPKLFRKFVVNKNFHQNMVLVKKSTNLEAAQHQLNVPKLDFNSFH